MPPRTDRPRQTAEPSPGSREPFTRPVLLGDLTCDRSAGCDARLGGARPRGRRSHASSGTLMALISFLVVQPIVEELVFRGALQGHLLGRGWNGVSARSPAPTCHDDRVSALHLLAQPPAWAIAVAVPSLVFGHLRERFTSVLPSIALHSSTTPASRLLLVRAALMPPGGIGPGRPTPNRARRDRPSRPGARPERVRLCRACLSFPPFLA